MFKNPMLKAKYNDFVDKYELNENPEISNIRKYICYTYMSQVQPDRLDRDFDLLDDICDERFSKFGIIGFAIALNNQLLTTKTDIDDILKNGCKAKFDIYLITDEIKTDCEKLLTKIIHEETEFEFIEALPYIYSQKIITKWEDLPTMNLVVISDEAKDPIFVKKDSVTEKICQINEDRLFRIAKANDNDYSLTLEYTDSITLSTQSEEGQTYVTLCNATQIVDILTNEDGMIRANMFDANVRAYQGNTDVNNEMIKTLQNCPENFVLYNNGITIVCNKLTPKGKTLTISNPQVVNGCQTCNSLYKATADGIDISKAKVIVKTIEAIGESVTQGIVRGTNRQNIVYEEAFETIRQFHKDFEDFVNIMEVPKLQKVYYERRSKQYSFDTQIKPYQKFNFRMLIQSTVALFMNKVEISHRHESKLIAEYKDILFVEGQSFYPYYVAALVTVNLDYIMKKERSLSDLRNYKMHILFVLQEMNMGPAPNINDKEEIEKYCKKFIAILTENDFRQLVLSAANRFRKLMNQWIDERGYNYKFAIKDNHEFTEFMLEQLRGNAKRKPTDSIYHGIVMNVNTDIHGNLYGFIKCRPNNIYFNELDNPSMNTSYEGKRVSYRVVGSGDETRAINVKPV